MTDSENYTCIWLLFVLRVNVEEILQFNIPYFLGYKTDFFPSKTIPKI